MRWKWMNRKHTREYVEDAYRDLDQTLGDLADSYIKADKGDRLSIVLDYSLNLELYKTVAPKDLYESRKGWLDAVTEVFELRLREE